MNTDNFCVIIFTNSAYSYLWPIMSDNLSLIPNLHIALNSDYDMTNSCLCGFNLLYYDHKDNYTKRILAILSNISVEYVFLIHDVDLVLNINIDKLTSYINCMKTHNIDRLSMGVFHNENKIVYDDVTICNIGGFFISRNFCTPYDVAPSVWKKDSLIRLCYEFPEENYSSLENNPSAQNFVRCNFKTYGICKNPNINLVYHRGFAYSEDFSFLHITVKGQFLPLPYYYDLTDKFTELVNKYNLKHISVCECSFIDKNVL